MYNTIKLLAEESKRSLERKVKRKKIHNILIKKNINKHLGKHLTNDE